MSDFAKLPVKDGFQGCFDYTNYNDGDTWINQYLGGSELNFTMINAIKNEGYILFPQMSGYAYLISDIGDNFTVYAIIKGDKSTSASSSNTCWTITTFGANSSYRVYVGQDGGTNKYNFWSPTGSSTNVSASEWHIIAYSVNNTVQKFYVDGELIKSVGTSRNFSVDNLCINTGSYNGAIPGIVQHSANVYVKYIGYATNNHSDIQIKQNSDWLLEQYGLKIPEKNSRLAGTDAVAIAYAIARNQESAETLRQLKKAYQEGMLDGDGDTKPLPFETTDPTPIIETDPNGGDYGQTDDGTVINLSKGIMAIYEKPDDPTDTVTVKIIMKHDEDTSNRYGYIYVEIYDNTGKELGGVPQHRFLTFQGNKVYHLENAYVSGSYRIECFTKYVCHFSNGSGYISGFYVIDNDDGHWTGGSSFISNPQWSIPSGYVYVGCKNI